MKLTPGAVLNGRYEIVRCIKSGGMGSVFEAKDLRLANTVCAVKEILESALQGPDADYIRQTFEKEMEALAQLEHTAIPRVRDYFQDDDKSYIVMDFVRGINLYDEIVQCKNATGVGIPARQAVEDILTLLEVVQYLHEQQPPILHRDIKPANILRDAKTGRIKLVDFGLAKAFGVTQSPQTQVGTLGYCALEQLSGNADTRSDLFSVGATLYHAVSGNNPVPNFIEGMHLNMPQLTPGLEAIVERATAVQSSARYPRAADFAADLKAWLNAESQGATMAPVPIPAPRPVPAPPAPIPEPVVVFSPLADSNGFPSEVHQPQPFSGWSRLGAAGAVTALIGFSLIGIGSVTNKKASPSPTPEVAVVSASPTPLTAAEKQVARERAERERKQQARRLMAEREATRRAEELLRQRAARLRPQEPPRQVATSQPTEVVQPRLDDGPNVPIGRPGVRQQGSSASASSGSMTRHTGGRTETVTFYPFSDFLSLAPFWNNPPALGDKLNQVVGERERWQHSSFQRVDKGRTVSMNGPNVSGGYHVVRECQGIIKVTIRPPLRPDELSSYDWAGLQSNVDSVWKSHKIP